MQLLLIICKYETQINASVHTQTFSRWTSLVVLTWTDWNGRRDLNVHVLCRCPRKLTSDEKKTHREGEKGETGEGEEGRGMRMGEDERRSGDSQSGFSFTSESNKPPPCCHGDLFCYPLFSELPLILAAFQSAGHVGGCAFVCWLLNESSKWKRGQLEPPLQFL